MAKRNGSKTAAKRSARKTVQVAAQVQHGNNGVSSVFARVATKVAHLAGKPATFLIAVTLVIAWAFSGPYFGFSDTWQLVINTSTTIVTFLMVFVIQNTQNRDTLAVQLKLAELIIAMEGAKNKIATIEDLSEEDLEQLHEGYRKRAEETLAHLQSKRGKELEKAS